MMLYTFKIVIALCVFKLGEATYDTITIYKKDDKFTFNSKLDCQNGVACASYNDTLMQDGWGVLNIRSGYGSSKWSNNDIAMAAGMAEGILTAKQIWENYENLKAFWFAKSKTSKSDIQKVKDFFNQQEGWMQEMIEKNKGADPLWRHAGYVLYQFHGLYMGYETIAKQNPTWDSDIFVVQMLNGVGDLIDLMYALKIKERPDYSTMSKQQLKQFVAYSGHCSALVKVTGALENIFMAHSSWFTYSATNRIYKHYNFNFDDPATAAKMSSFSSYPGFLESLDDFYLLSSNLVMLQTTNNVFNHTLYEAVKPQSLLAWQRVRMANYMAHNGREWADVLKEYNSGTYNNQYMVIDLNKVELNKDIHDDALWVVEQIPTLVVAHDQTPILRAGYWPSYNVPFYEKIYNMSGYPEIVAKSGPDFSYQLAPRAKIFRRDQTTVKDMDSFKAIMRYNDYKHDKYSENNPCDTICCRGDLNDPAATMGCYDSKVTDYKMALQLQSYAINGPTVGTGLKPFSWTGPFENQTHIGLPETYNFGWNFMQPKSLK